MQGISAAWLYPIILVEGALQAWGPPMNGVLRNALTNPWLASLVSFLPIVAFLACLFFCLPRPLPTADGIGGMPWWAPLGGLVGSLAVVAGLLFVDKVGAGTFAGLTITANILMSLAIDKFGWFGMEVHPLSGGVIDERRDRRILADDEHFGMLLNVEACEIRLKSAQLGQARPQHDALTFRQHGITVFVAVRLEIQLALRDKLDKPDLADLID